MLFRSQQKEQEETVAKLYEATAELEDAQGKLQTQHSELTTLRSNLAAAHDAAEEKDGEIAALKEEVARLTEVETQHTELQTAHEALVQEAAAKDEAQKKLEAEKQELQTQLEQRATRVGELEAHVASLEHDVSVLVETQRIYSERPTTEEHNKAVAELNYFKKKSESLSATMERMLRNGGAKRDMDIDLDAIHAQADSGDKRVRELAEQLEAYKKALNREVNKNKAYADAYNSAHAAAGSHQSQKQVADLKQLANMLMEDLKDKEIALQLLRDCNKGLGARVQELEERILQK